jgi:hypothetical protein
MPEALMSAFVGGGGQRQLLARAADLTTIPITLDHLINAPLKRGALLKSATVDGVFVLCKTGANMPVDATDVIVVLARDQDLTGAAADVKSVAYVEGEFVREAVIAASDVSLLAADIVAIHEMLLKRSMNLVHTMYGANTESVL